MSEEIFYKFVGGISDGAIAQVPFHGGSNRLWVAPDPHDRGAFGMMAHSKPQNGWCEYELQDIDLYVHGDFHSGEGFEEVASKQDRRLLRDIFGGFSNT